jgi:hypothetical protein
MLSLCDLAGDEEGPSGCEGTAAASVLSLPLEKAGYDLPEMDASAAFTFVLSKIGGAPSPRDVGRLRAKFRVTAEPAVRVDEDAGQQLSSAAGDQGAEGACAADGEAPAVGGFPVQQPPERRAPRRYLRQRGLSRAEATAGGPAGEHEARRPFDPPTSMQRLPRLMSSNCCKQDVIGERQAGNEADDESCEDEVSELYWLLAADRISGLAGMAGRLDDGSHRHAMARHACHLLLESSMLLQHFAAASAIHASRNAISRLAGFCSRLLELRPPEDVVVALAGQLLNVRDAQLQETGLDSICVLLTTAQLPPVNHRHHAVSVLWVELLQYCDAAADVPPFWDVLNRVAPAFRRAKFSAAGKRLLTAPHSKTLSTPACARRQVLTDWEEWCFDAAVALGSLYAVGLVDDGEESPVAADAPPLAPNWSIIDALLDDLRAGAAAPADDPDALPGRLFEVLRRVALDVACGLWPVTEELLTSALNLVHDIYATRKTGCLCAHMPTFLVQLRCAPDVRLRRSFLMSHVKTPCDCLVLLSWLLVSQSSLRVSGKVAGKVIRLGSTFASAVSQFSASTERSRGFRHAISLTLAVADAIASPSAGTQDGEDLFRSLMFAKAPSLSKAAKSPHAVGLVERANWSSVLDAVVLRSRILMSTGRTFACYVDFIATSFAQVSRCLERPEEHFKGDVSKREAARVQHRLVLELAVEMLDTVTLLVAAQETRAASASDDSAAAGVHAAVDTVLGAVASMVDISGKLLQAVLSQLRSSAVGATAPVPRRGILVSTIRMLDGAMTLATSARRQHKRRAPPPLDDGMPGLEALVTAVQAVSMTAMVDVVGRGIVLSDEALDREVRDLATATLARVVGHSALITSSPPAGSEGSPAGWSTLTAVQRAGMDFSSSSSGGPDARQQQTAAAATRAVTACSSAPGAAGAPGNSSLSLLSSRHGRRMAADFWSILVDTLWVDAVLGAGSTLERMVIAAWIVLMSAPEAVASPQPVLKLAWSLKAACASRPFIASFFRDTLLHERMVKSDPRMPSVVVELRPQTVTDAIAVTVTHGFFPPHKLRALLCLLSAVMCEGGMAASNPAWTKRRPDGDGGDDDGRPPFQCMRFHLAFTADLSALIFAVRASLRSCLAVPSAAAVAAATGARAQARTTPAALAAHHVRDVLDEGRRSLETVCDAALRLADSTGVQQSGAGPDVAATHGRVAALVLHGMSCLGYDGRAVELRVRFMRFAKLLGDASLESLVVPLARLPLPQWVATLGLPSTSGAESEATLAQRRARRGAGDEWRKLVLHSLVEDPLMCSPFTSPAYRAAAERLLAVLGVHERAETDAAGVARDVRASLARVMSSLPGERVGDDSATAAVCRRVGFKVESMFGGGGGGGGGGGDGAAHAQGLVALGTGIVGQASVLLEGVAP